MKLTLGFSPCPNDTFIFDALVHQKIDTGGIEFDIVLEDIETLNEWALEGRLDITKLSFPAFFKALEKYVLLDSGSALGSGVGPLLIRKKKSELPSRAEQSEAKLENEEVAGSLIALPGENTTANFLFSFAYPHATAKVFMRFDRIEDWVLEEEGRLGVIIHENRFTYQQKGLDKLMDLGAYWEDKMKLPIPLGGIAIKREIETDISRKVNQLIKQSLEYARSNYPVLPDYVKLYSQTMSEEVMRQHIDLYVNNYSLDLGSGGKKAVRKFYETYLDQLRNQDRDDTGELFIS